jgi:uncharacterized protein (TIGR04222 family)
MPNPFDLRGPEFLLFYLFFGIVVTAVVMVLRHRGEPPLAGTAPLTDYLKIAYLRGGSAEAIRVASLALMDRGLLQLVDAHHVKTAVASLPAGLQRTEERLLEACREPVRASSLLDDTALQVAATVECEPQLVRAGLLPDEQLKGVWTGLRAIALLVLGSVAALKIFVALGRGRTNIGFLIILAGIFGAIIYLVTNPSRTAAGDAMLADLRTLFAAVRARAGIRRYTPGTGGNDLALLAAVFGATSVPAGALSTQTLFRKPQPRSGNSCGSSGGSACGSSSGSSCGSSCGGGGCGGGCGGCGS